jgi:hypothetical protein
VVLLVARPAAPDVELPADAAWTTTSVPRYGVAVSLPAGWRLARQSLTPRLYDPREIVTATTFRPCPSHVPARRSPRSRSRRATRW